MVIWVGLVQMILISFTHVLIVRTSKKRERIELVFCRRTFRTGSRVKEYKCQGTKRSKITKMKAGKAPRPDSILPSVLKCAHKLSKSLGETFNVSLQECVVPAKREMS